jgi:hypothetical protein
VDGLLGIGAAGGKSSSSEGTVLASRLETLRKERAARAPEVRKKMSEPVAAGGGDRSTAKYGDAPPSRRNAGNKGRKKGKRRKQ